MNLHETARQRLSKGDASQVNHTAKDHYRLFDDSVY